MKRLLLMLLLVAALSTSAFLLLRPATQASPDVTITVNSTADTNTRDTVMTLREAMLMATGDLAVTSLSNAECNQVSGASWSLLWCMSPVPIGPTTPETIVFDTYVFPPGSPATIALTSTLPTLDTGGNDIIDGSSAGVIVSGVSKAFDCFSITSERNIIKGLQIRNCYAGVLIGANAQFNTIGGTAASDRNVISGNTWGVEIEGYGADGNAVKGNYIGTDASGTAALANGRGVLIHAGAEGNTVGGTTAGERNVISGNESGVAILDSPTRGNSVKGNYIGTDATGTTDLGNSEFGLEITGSVSNTVGGTTAGERNVISGNRSGVAIYGSGDIVVKGNYIGTDASGTQAVPNGSGVLFDSYADNNTIGGTAAGERNVISGNVNGVEIAGAANLNTVEGNYIGTDATGTSVVANDVGVYIHEGAQDNTIGGTTAGARNVISGNGRGVMIVDSGTTGNAVKGNYIGTDASGTVPMPNDAEGVVIGYGKDNVVGGTAAGEGNVIAFNAWDGVSVYAPGATGNTVRGNSIHSNDEEGISNSSGGNNELTPPTITGFGSVTGTACAGCTIDIYSDNQDEGRVYEGSTTANGAGNWIFSGSPEGPHVTATATDAAGNTSEFSTPVDVPEATATPSPTPTPTPSPTATRAPSTTATPPAGPTRTVVWSPGWHNATWSGSSTPAEAFACAAGKYTAAYRLVNGSWQRYFPDRPDISNMSPLAQYDAFLILITQPVTCVMPVGAASGSSRTLEGGAGWYNLAWSGSDGTAPQDAFACAAGKYAAAYRFTDAGLERYFPDRPDISNMGPLNKCDAFLILVTAPATCVMPVAP